MEHYLVMDFIYMTIERIAFGFMCYIPFWDRLRVKKITISILIPVCVSIINALIVFNDLNESIDMAIFLAVTGVMFYITVDSIVGKKAFVFMIVLNYAAILFNIIVYFSLLIFKEHFTVYYNEYEIGILLVALVLTYPVFARLMQTRIKPILNQPSPNSIWHLMWVIPAVFAINVEFMYLATDQPVKETFVFLVVTLLMLLGAVIVYYYLYRLFSGLKNSAVLEEKIKITEMQLALQHDQYEVIKSNIDLMRRVKHDTRHHFNVLFGYVEKNDVEGIKDYLNSFIELMPSDEIQWCENRAIDAIISHYYGLAKKKNIKFNIDVDVPEYNDPECDSDLSIIFGNLIENAIDATKTLDQSKEKPYISLSCKLKNKYLVISVVNPFDGNWKKSGDVFISTKHEGYGIGVESVKSVVEKCGGTTEFSIDKTIFTASIILESPEPLSAL